MIRPSRPLCLLFALSVISVAAAAPPPASAGSAALPPLSAATQTPPAAENQPTVVDRPLVAGVKVAPPFAILNDGHYSGLAIDLWQEVAADQGWKYQYKPYDLEGLLNAVSAAQVDVGLGAITATAEREKRMDFPHSLTSSGLGVAVRSQQTAGWLAVVQALFSMAFLKVIATLVLLLLIVGMLM